MKQIIRTKNNGEVEIDISTKDYCRVWDLIGCPRSCWNCKNFSYGACLAYGGEKIPANYADIISNDCPEFMDKEGIPF